MAKKIENIHSEISNLFKKSQDLLQIVEKKGFDYLWKINNIPYFFISHYDHWLTEEEAENFISYPAIIHNLKDKLNPRVEEYKNVENNYLTFFMNLLKRYNIFIYNEKKRLFENIKLKSENNIKKIFINHIREKKLRTFLVIELEVLLIGDYDINQIVFHFNEKKIHTLKEDALKNNLHILN